MAIQLLPNAENDRIKRTRTRPYGRVLVLGRVHWYCTTLGKGWKRFHLESRFGFRRRGGKGACLHLRELVGLAVVELGNFAVVPVLDRTVVAGNAGVDFRFAAADRALEVLAVNVAVLRADRVGRGEGVVRELEVLGNLADEDGSVLPVRKFLSQEAVEYGAAGVQGLHVIFQGQGVKDVVRVADRQMRAVGVVRGAAVSRL